MEPDLGESTVVLGFVLQTASAPLLILCGQEKTPQALEGMNISGSLMKAEHDVQVQC